MFAFLQTMDSALLLFLQEYVRAAILTPLMVFFSTLGNAGVFWIVLGLLLALIPKTRKYGVLALASLLVCFLCNNVLLKNLVARPRPYTQIPTLTMLMECPSDYSFPSGHACSSFAVAGSLCWSMEKRWNWMLLPSLTLALLIPFPRLLVCVHNPSDVLVGAAIGLVGSYLICRYGAGCYDRLAARWKR